jgi:hypothetical protein
MRLRTRVTLVSAVLMAVVLSATGVFVYLRLQTEFRRTLDETLRSGRMPSSCSSRILDRSRWTSPTTRSRN